MHSWCNSWTAMNNKTVQKKLRSSRNSSTLPKMSNDSAQSCWGTSQHVHGVVESIDNEADEVLLGSGPFEDLPPRPAWRGKQNKQTNILTKVILTTILRLMTINNNLNLKNIGKLHAKKWPEIHKNSAKHICWYCSLGVKEHGANEFQHSLINKLSSHHAYPQYVIYPLSGKKSRQSEVDT